MSRRAFASCVAVALMVVLAFVGTTPPAHAVTDKQKLTVTTSSTPSEVTVMWTAFDTTKAPSDVGVGYTVKALQPGIDRPADYCSTDGSAILGLTCTLRGLKPGITYDVVVDACSLYNGRLHAAWNPQGPGCWGDMNTLGTGRTGYVTLCCQIPSAPQGVVSADSTGGAISVAWNPPTFAGGSESLDYVVTTDPNSTGCTTATLTCTIEGLPFATPVTATVVARSSAGSGPPGSAPPVTLIAPKPGQPFRVTGKVLGTSKILVTWKAPLDAAQLPVTSFKVLAKPGGKTCSARTTRCTVSKLKRGVAYTFTVRAYRATTASGLSRPSSSVTIPLPPPPPTPTPTPSTPTAPAPAPVPTPKPTASFG